ncbi:DUF3732 domain-containing protein [Alkanindiges illinoisensis]
MLFNPIVLYSYFLSLPHHPISALLVYDHPSQVYFPKINK